MNTCHEEFRKAMLDANIRQVARFVTPEGLEPKSEIHVWLGVNGVFLTQTWGEDDGYELYYPSREHGRAEAIEEAVKFATVKEFPVSSNNHAALLNALKQLYHLSADLPTGPAYTEATEAARVAIERAEQ